VLGRQEIAGYGATGVTAAATLNADLTEEDLAVAVARAVSLLKTLWRNVMTAECTNMGGTANLFTLTEKSGIGAVTGVVDGAAYGEPTSEPEDIGDGSFTFAMFHHFLDKDGSRLHTHDRVTVRVDPKTEVSAMEVEYTVVDGTGRFVGYGGTFRSRGWTKPADDGDGAHTVGVVRFEGQICRK